MVRTIITIPKPDKEWLDRYSHMHHQSIAETVRQAIHCYQFQIESEDDDTVLRETAGLWRDRGKDGLVYQREMRDEWKRDLQ
ncbi:MAG: CopG family transcriptional regulator [Verrucomicrobiota bacterium]